MDDEPRPDAEPGGGPDRPEGISGAAPRTRFRVGRWAVAAVAGLFVVAGAGIGIKLFALRGAADVLQQMVPADADVYATAYLDPSLAQKLHLRTMVEKFPALNGPVGLDQRIDEFLSQAIQEGGLDFAKDVKPWLGTQLGMVVRIDDAGSHVALLVASKDDAAAQAALAKVRKTSEGTWTDGQHDGVAIVSGQDRTGEPFVYAFLDHTAILSDQQAMVEDIIDADRGGAATLASTPIYARALEGLPKDRLGFVYVNSGRLIDQFLPQLDQEAGLDLNMLNGPLSGLGAYRSVGAAVSAESSGVAIHVSVDIDSSKLTAEQRDVLAGAGHRNAVIDWTPDDALGLIAVTGFGDAVQSFVDTAGGTDPEVQRTLEDLGVTGPEGFIAHMTGDAGVTATAGTQGAFPNVAVLAGTDDEAAAKRFLANLQALVNEDLGASNGHGPIWQVESYESAPYGAVEITWLGDPDLQSQGIEPAYAAVKDMTILGSSRAAVKAALDAHGGAGSIAGSATFRDALGGSEGDANLIEYFDVQGITQAVVESLSSEERPRFERDVAPNLRPVKAFAATQSSGPDRSTVRVFVLIR